MTPRAAQARRSGGKPLALVTALVFLAVIGGTTGYVLGLRQVHLRAVAAENPAVGGSESGSGAGAGRGSSAPPTSGPTSGPTAGPTATGKPCPAEAEKLVKTKFGSPGGLRQVMYINTKAATSAGHGSEVWICRDSSSRLFYQGHAKSPAEEAGGPREELRDLDNALLLASPVPQGTNRYLATNNDAGKSTTYAVSATTLVVTRPDGTSWTEAVLNAEY